MAFGKYRPVVRSITSYIRSTVKHSLSGQEERYFFRRLYSTSANKQQEKGKTWFSGGNEWKIIGTVAFAIVSWYINALQDRQHSRKQSQMDLVSRQIKELYGPLYGNRLVAEKGYRAAMKEFGGLRIYLQEAEINRDAEMIRRWRSYVWSTLYPLDKEAVDLICSKAHLITDAEFPEEFERFLCHKAKMQFIMEQWKNEKGHLESIDEFTDDDYLEETNSTGLGGSKKIIGYLRDRCTELRKKQQKFSEDISVDSFQISFVSKLTK